jgi:D-alanyl-lipoteichoic acid acyltransferase DltB (MBOAT superfamily)
VLITAIAVLFSALGKLSIEVLASNLTVADVVVFFCANRLPVITTKDKKRNAFFICLFFWFNNYSLFKVDLLKLIAVASNISL